jgi:hypothetical protein
MYSNLFPSLVNYVKPTVVDYAIRFAAQKPKEESKLSSNSSNEDYKEKANESVYDQDKNILNEEQPEEAISNITIYEVF